MRRIAIFCIHCSHRPTKLDIKFYIEDLEKYFCGNDLRLDWVCEICKKKNYTTVKDIDDNMKKMVEEIKRMRG